MFKVRIDVPGWESYSDLFCMVPFENGVSTRPVTDQEALRIGAIIKCVRVDNDEQLGAATVMAESKNVSAAIVPELAKASDKPETEIVLKYSKDKLEEIASEGGIKAIREVAKEFDVKGVEISKIIDEIMKVQLGTKEEA